jgi:hypothetical protein
MPGDATAYGVLLWKKAVGSTGAVAVSAEKVSVNWFSASPFAGTVMPLEAGMVICIASLSIGSEPTTNVKVPGAHDALAMQPFRNPQSDSTSREVDVFRVKSGKPIVMDERGTRIILALMSILIWVAVDTLGG